MATQASLSDSRKATLRSVLTHEETAVFDGALAAKTDKLSDALPTLEGKLPAKTLDRLKLADHVAELSGDKSDVATAMLTKAPDATTLGDIARAISLADLTEICHSASSPPEKQPQDKFALAAAATESSPAQIEAKAVRKRLFALEPTAVAHRMLMDNEIVLPNHETQQGVVKFLSNLPQLNLGQSSVLGALKSPVAFSGIPVSSQAKVETAVKQLTTVHLLVSAPESIPKLLKANVSSGFQVSSIPKQTFVQIMQHQHQLSEEEARSIHGQAVKGRRRNEHALITMLQTVRGSGIAAVDGPGTLESRKTILATKLNKALAGESNPSQSQDAPPPTPTIDLESLFGSLDYCECSDCQSVTSPSAYYVELLQFLRNNTLSWDTATFKNSGQEGIGGTALEALFARRPDLGCIELTCENTNTVLPYLDLANEVMESFVVHRHQYEESTTDPKQAIIDVYNVTDEASSELLAEPQHTNYQAYCILKDAVFPLVNAPYHQAIDEARIFLAYLGTSRYELLSTFQPRYVASSKWSDAQNTALATQHQRVLDRAATAEFWFMIQVDYIAITRESYWPVEFWEIIKAQPNITPNAYQANIGRKKPWQYWGYNSETEMDNPDATIKTGLTFVKAQLLPRSGLVYTDLVDLVQTRYINPNYPTGIDLQILESIRFSYKYLKDSFDKSKDPKDQKWTKMAKFLLNWRDWALKHSIKKKDLPAPSQLQLSAKELACWLKNWFRLVGKLIVLESNAKPQFPIEGYIVAEIQVEDLRAAVATLGPAATSAKPQTTSAPPPGSITGHPVSNSLVSFGYLNRDGTVVDGTTVIGSVAPDGTLEDNNGQPFMDSRTHTPNWDQIGILDSLVVNNPNPDFTKPLGMIDPDTSKLFWPQDNNIRRRLKEDIITYLPATETCNIDDVQLIHLDGTYLTCDEWDRMQAFIRLYRKLGFTIDETDQALAGLTTPNSPTAPPATSPQSPDTTNMDNITDWSQIIDGKCKSCGHSTCNCGETSSTPDDNCDCPPFSPPTALNITPDFLEQLIAVKTLLGMTSLTLVQLLCLWTDIPTRGNPSLYSTLFLPHNISGIDPIFQADSNGNFLTDGTVKIQDHVPVILAAFHMSAADLAAVVSLGDTLNLQNVSKIYRHVILGRILSTKVISLPDIVSLFGDPFKNAEQTLAFVKTWQKMSNTGFTFAQMNYLIANKNDPLRPIGPSMATILATAKTIFDGLNDIATQNPDPTDPSVITADTVRSEVSQVFDANTTTSISGLVEGTTVYTTNAPSGLNIVVPVTLTSKLSYQDNPTASPPRATLSITGILTTDEVSTTKSLSTSTDWAAAVDRAGKQPVRFFNDVLAPIFVGAIDAGAKLLAGDIPPPPPPKSSSDPPVPDNSTAPGKRLYLLQGLMPFIRDTLGTKLVISSVSGPANLSSPEMATILLSTILTAGTPSTSALKALKNIQAQPANSSNSWTGFLIPSSTDQFIFYANGGFKTQPPFLTIGTNVVPFSHQQDDPNDAWYTDPVPLISGKLYKFQVTGQGISNLEWRTPKTPPSTIPNSALLPDYSSQPTTEVFIEAFKAGLVINNFNLTLDEVTYFYSNAADFASLDFNAVTLAAWGRLADYSVLQTSMPAMPNTVLDLFKWSKSNPAATPDALVSFIVSVTNWATDDVTKLIVPNHLNLQDPRAFSTEIPLAQLQKRVVAKTKIGIDVDLLFTWADPMSFLWDRARAIAESIRKQVRSRYDVDTWEQVAQPLFNKLRRDQRDALIAFLLVQKSLQDWGVVDADSLFEFFLVDVQMSSCLQTSRIKQAISTVQLFIDRSLMNLEQNHGVDRSTIAEYRWDSWMNGYRLWQADREVFLWPENWLDPSLRDDKSEYFTSLEAKLLQKDVTAQNVQNAMKNYLFNVDKISRVDVIGLVKEKNSDPTNTKPGILHIFGKSVSSPWTYFYRQWLDDGTWKPWELLDTDILTYDNTGSGGNLIQSGTYLLPVVWNSRLLIFLPQFSKVRKPLDNTTKIGSLQTSSVGDNIAEYWEIKMGWSEYRNGAWTTKQVTSGVVSNVPTAASSTLPGINTHQFIPQVTGTAPDTTIEIDVFQAGPTILGSFVFDGSRVVVKNPSIVIQSDGSQASSTIPSTNDVWKTNFLSLDSGTAPSISRYMYSFQDNGPGGQSPLSDFDSYPYAYSSSATYLYTGTQEYDFYDPISHQLLAVASTAPTVDGVFDYFQNITDPSLMADVFGSLDDPVSFASDYNELAQPYSIYHWELGCHAPMLLMNKFLATQQFQQALDVAAYVFNPFATRSATPQPGDVWCWPPFKNVLPEDALELLFAKLKPNKSNKKGDAIETWRDNPFQPFVVARSRRQAFMRWFAIQYIQILIQWGDWYFMQNTLETIPYAIQLYVRASHIYGPRPMSIPARGKKQPQTYNSLLDKWDGFSNAVVQMELAFPFSNQSDKGIGQIYDEKFLGNVFGFATSTYFCVPNNAQLLAVRDLIDDRLYKIRNCMDINGVVRQLPLFEPPLDPGLLVQAAAAGLNFNSVIADLYAPLPNYKCYPIVQKAIEACNELKGLGSLFLSNKEKLDNETLAQIRSRQDVTIGNLIMQLKTQALTEANLALDSLQANRTTIEYRMRHVINLIGETLDRIPTEDADYQELDDSIEAIVLANNPMRLMSYESTELSKASDANDQNNKTGYVETTAAGLHIIPNTDEDGEPWGIGIGLRWGAENFAAAASAVARYMKIQADDLTYESSNSSRMATFKRQLQDRIAQLNTAGHEMKAVDAQIKDQTQKITMAGQEVTNQQTSIDNANEVYDFLRNKYSNVALYTWMDNRLQTLYYQAYTLSYQLAKKAERAFCYERGIDPATAGYISFGYWDPAHDGLLAAESLMQGLKRLEADYQQDRGYDFEVTRHVSLRQLNPLALLGLRELGSCQVSLPETFFDMDFPGQYMRRIKSVALSIPCIVGPYTSVSCTLRLLSSEYRASPSATDKGSYPKTDPSDSRFHSDAAAPVSAIAVSGAQNDAGVFELNFRDTERFLPFEGAGAISSWSIELPGAFRQWDYGTIADVVMHVRYTAKDGGDKLAGVAAGAVADFVANVENLSQDQGLFAMFDLRGEFASEWARAAPAPTAGSGSTGPTVKTVVMKGLADRLPAYTKGRDPKKVLATDVFLMLSPNPSWVSQATLLTPDGSNPSLSPGDSVGQTTVWKANAVDTPITDWTVQLSGSGSVALAKGYVVVRYELK